MFGVTAAPEKYQQIVGDMLSSCAGVANIADDLIVHGLTQVNGDKCELGCQSLHSTAMN